jgi:hypothetical protein
VLKKTHVCFACSRSALLETTALVHGYRVA